MERENNRPPQQELDRVVNAKLSPELARTDPGLYKARLVNVLDPLTRFSGKAWSKLCDAGMCSFSDLEIDASTAMSQSRGSKIIIGAQPWPENLKSLCIFEPEDFGAEKEKVLILTHEMGHKLLGGDSDSEITSFFNTLRQIRQTTGKGLSGLGSLSLYKDKGVNTQASEDFIELLTKYLIDPNYLIRFLNYLTEAGAQESKNNSGLVSLSPNQLKPIYDTVQGIARKKLGL